MLLSLRKSGVEIKAGSGDGVVSQTVDNNTVGPCEAAWVRRDLFLVPHEGGVMDIVLDENRTQIDIPVAARGPMNHERTDQAVRVLLRCKPTVGQLLRRWRRHSTWSE